MIQSGRMTKDTPETVSGMFVVRWAVQLNNGREVGTGGALGFAYEQADAQLWSAAPQLLELAQSCLEVLRDQCGFDPSSPIIVDLQSAIAKAEGR